MCHKILKSFCERTCLKTIQACLTIGPILCSNPSAAYLKSSVIESFALSISRSPVRLPADEIPVEGEEEHDWIKYEKAKRADF